MKINLKKMIDGRKRFRGRLAGTENDQLILLDTGFGRVSFTMADIDTARIDPTEYFSTPAGMAQNNLTGICQKKKS